MSNFNVRSDATFSPADYRASIAEMFSELDASQQREFADKIALLPRYIHQLASNGLIAAPIRKSRKAGTEREINASPKRQTA